MNKKLDHQALLGAASMAAGLIKTLASAWMPRKKNWPEKAKDAASQLANGASLRINKKMLLGTLAGGIIGVTTTLLLTSKKDASVKKTKSEGQKAKKKAVTGVKKPVARKKKSSAAHPQSKAVNP